jgi:hypothetical protein
MGFQYWVPFDKSGVQKSLDTRESCADSVVVGYKFVPFIVVLLELLYFHGWCNNIQEARRRGIMRYECQA